MAINERVLSQQELDADATKDKDQGVIQVPEGEDINSYPTSSLIGAQTRRVTRRNNNTPYSKADERSQGHLRK